MRKFPINCQIYSNYSVDINSFYKNINGTSFKGINVKKLIELRKTSKSLNSFYTNKNIEISCVAKYIKIMNKIKTTPKEFNISSQAEKFILFMFSVDPNFEAAKIYGTCNRKDEIKLEMEKYFGIYDSRLITIENFFIKHFLSEKKRNEINEEIEIRVYK